MGKNKKIHFGKIHQSMRGFFGFQLFNIMREDENIYLLMGDLGYGLFNKHRASMPDRCINVGAAEQCMLDIGVGIAQSGKIPIIYSITPFLIYRPFETIRTYIDHENIKILMVGGGRDKDYQNDGWSHHATDVKPFMNLFKNIEKYYPKDKEEITSEFVKDMLQSDKPCFLSLKR